jgi:hypothetical protein
MAATQLSLAAAAMLLRALPWDPAAAVAELFGAGALAEQAAAATAVGGGAAAAAAAAAGGGGGAGAGGSPGGGAATAAAGAAPSAHPAGLLLQLHLLTALPEQVLNVVVSVSPRRREALLLAMQGACGAVLGLLGAAVQGEAAAAAAAAEAEAGGASSSAPAGGAGGYAGGVRGQLLLSALRCLSAWSAAAYGFGRDGEDGAGNGRRGGRAKGGQGTCNATAFFDVDALIASPLLAAAVAILTPAASEQPTHASLGLAGAAAEALGDALAAAVSPFHRGTPVAAAARLLDAVLGAAPALLGVAAAAAAAGGEGPRLGLARAACGVLVQAGVSFARPVVLRVVAGMLAAQGVDAGALLLQELGGGGSGGVAGADSGGGGGGGGGDPSAQLQRLSAAVAACTALPSNELSMGTFEVWERFRAATDAARARAAAVASAAGASAADGAALDAMLEGAFEGFYGQVLID